MLGDYYTGQIVSLPKKLIKLKFSKKFRYYFSDIPETLKIIELYSNYLFIDEIMNKFPNIEFSILY